MTASKSASRSANRFSRDEDLDVLESLVDELVKDRPEELRVRSCMEAAGLSYMSDPIARLNTVLERLDKIRAARRQQGRVHDGESEL